MTASQAAPRNTSLMQAGKKGVAAVNCMTATGRTLAENLGHVAGRGGRDAIRAVNISIAGTGGIFGPKDNLAIGAVDGRLDVALSETELPEPARKKKPRATDYQSAGIWKYVQTVGSAREGAVTHPGGARETHCYADS